MSESARCRPVWPLFAVIFIILGGVYFGWMTPTEAGANGLPSVVLMPRSCARQHATDGSQGGALRDLKLPVMIFTIVWGVMIFVRFLGFSGLPREFASWIAGLPYVSSW